MLVKFNKYRWLCLLLGICAVGLQAQAKPQLVDKIVAVVGEHAILYSEAKAKTEGGQLVNVSDFPAPLTASRAERAINDLINMQLIKNALADLDIQVSDAEVEREIATFLKQKDLTRVDLDGFLHSQSRTYEHYKQDFKNQLTLRKFHGALIVPTVKITDKDIKTYYLKKSGHLGDMVTLDLQQIFGKDKQLMAEAHRRLQQGTPFAEVSAQYHDQQHDSSMPEVQLQDLSPALRNALRALQEGQYSPPLTTAAGQHIFYVIKRRVNVDTAFAASKDELEMELRQHELTIQTRVWLQKQRATTNIKLL